MENDKDKKNQLIEYGKNTRFGSDRGADPSEAGRKGAHKKWSVRDSSRRMAALTVGEAKEMMENIDELTVAQAVALAKFQKAMKGDTKAMLQFTEDVDGKLVDRKVHAEVTLADLVTGSLEYDEEFSRDGVIDAETFEASTEADSSMET